MPDVTLFDAAFYHRLGTYFSDPPIIELGSWTALTRGHSGWVAMLRVFPERDRAGNYVSQADAPRIY